MPGPQEARTRLLVLTDISTLEVGQGEPDDTQSLIRLLLYANDFDIEGLIATHTYTGDGVNTDFIRSIVNEYARVHPNLLMHDPRYPSAEALLSVIKAGSGEREAIGEGKDSEGSDWIISVLDKPDPRPLWITIWGGSRELAQALWKLQRTRTPLEFARIKSRIRVYAINDQDATGPWIRKNNPDLFYIISKLAYRGLYRGGDTSLVSPEWVERNVRKGHGPLGAAYPNYRGGDPWGPVRGIKEGDTPSFLYLVPNGLGSPEHPSWGSWGGRFTGIGPHFTDAKDTVGEETCEQATVYRWRAAFQASFQARMDWCVEPYGRANHQPIACVSGPLTQTVSSGEKVKLSAHGSHDPDGHALNYSWEFYPEPSTFKGNLRIESSREKEAAFVAPEVDSPATIHIILTVTDAGDPPLSSYRRVIVTVYPRTNAARGVEKNGEARSSHRAFPVCRRGDNDFCCSGNG